MASTFYLEVLTPERIFYTGPAQEVIFQAIDGLHGVLPSHEPMVTALSAGEMKYKVDDEWRVAALGTGFAEIMPEYVIILVDTAERPEEIDLKRAELARERAEERLRQKRSLEEYYQSQAALSRALARLKAGRDI